MAQPIQQILSQVRHDSLSNLEVVQGYAELLLHGSFGTLSSEQTSAVAKVYRFARRAVQDWYVLEQFVRLTEGEETPPSLQAIPIQRAVEQAVFAVREQSELQNISLKLPTEPVFVASHEDLVTVYTYLLGSNHRPQKLIDRSKPWRALQVTLLPSSVLTEIFTSLVVATPEKTPLTPEEMFGEASAYAVAQLMLERQGCPLHYATTAQYTKFSFTLPLWHTDSKETHD